MMESRNSTKAGIGAAWSRYAKARTAGALALLIFLVPTHPAFAKGNTLSCTAANVILNYGSYDVLAGTVLDAAGSITVTCTASGRNSGTVAYTAALSPLPVNQLAPPSGTDRLSHQLYLDSARTQPWGDGTAGTSVISSSFTLNKNGTASDVPINFYGRIPGGQDVSAASPGPPPTTYTQTFTVTVTCTAPAPC
jgi:spore coat protein U-like protein